MPLFSLSYWFSLSAIPFIPWIDRALSIFCAALLVIGLGLSVYAVWAKGLERSHKKLLKDYAGMLMTAGLTGLLLWFLNSQSVPVLSMRFFWIIWLGIFVCWTYMIINYQFKELPKKIAEREKTEALRKWWPKPKRK